MTSSKKAVNTSRGKLIEHEPKVGAVYHSKVVILCWAAIYVAATVAAILKRRWIGLRHIVVGAAIVTIGIALSSFLKNEVGALMLSAALLISTYFALTGIIKTFSKE